MTISWINDRKNIAITRVAMHASSRIAQRYNAPCASDKIGSIYLRHSEMINDGKAKLLYTREENNSNTSFVYELIDDNSETVFPLKKHIEGVGPMIVTYLSAEMIEYNLTGVDDQITLMTG